jgi:hypothetical protein
MRWDLILLFSVLGLVSGIINLFGLIDINPYFISIAFWIISALVLGRFAKKKHFMHGFWAGAIGSLLGSILMYIFFDTYASHNAQMAEAMSKMPEGFDMRSVMLVGVPFGIAIGGVVLGLLTLLVGKTLGEPEKPAAAVTPPADEPPQTPEA